MAAMAAMVGVEGIVAKEDGLGGVVVDMLSFPSTGRSTFANFLRLSLECWRRQKKKAVWLKLLSEDATFMLPAIQEGFVYHHTEPPCVMLVLWLGDEPSTLPANASNQVGVGPSFSLNDCLQSERWLQCTSIPRQSHGAAIGNTGHDRSNLICPSPPADAIKPSNSNLLTWPIRTPQTDQGWIPRGNGKSVVDERGSTSMEDPLIQSSEMVVHLVPAGMGNVDPGNTQPALRRSAAEDHDHASEILKRITTGQLDWVQGHEQTVNDGVEVTIADSTAIPTKRRAHSQLDKSAPKMSRGKKRSRGPDFDDDEKHDLLVWKLEFHVTWGMRGKSGESWSTYVFELLLVKYGQELYGIIRTSTSCQQQWDTLLKQFKAIRAYELKIQSGTSSTSCVNFWTMNEDERNTARINWNEKHLPRVFYYAWYVLVERISCIQVQLGIKPPRARISGSVQVGTAIRESSSTLVATTITDSANFTAGLPSSDAGNDVRSPSSNSHEIQIPTQPDPLAYNNFASTEYQGSAQRQPEGESSEMPELDDGLIERLVPRITSIVIEKFELKIQPLMAMLRTREEDEQKMRVIREEQLALTRGSVRGVQLTENYENAFVDSIIMENAGNSNLYAPEAAGVAASNAETSLRHGQHADYFPQNEQDFSYMAG